MKYIYSHIFCINKIKNLQNNQCHKSKLEGWSYHLYKLYNYLQSLYKFYTYIRKLGKKLHLYHKFQMDMNTKGLLDLYFRNKLSNNLLGRNKFYIL